MNEYFGFDLQQIKTLERLLASGDSGLAALSQAVTALQSAVEDLDERVTELESA